MWNTYVYLRPEVLALVEDGPHHVLEVAEDEAAVVEEQANEGLETVDLSLPLVGPMNKILLSLKISQTNFLSHFRCLFASLYADSGSVNPPLASSSFSSSFSSNRRSWKRSKIKFECLRRKTTALVFPPATHLLPRLGQPKLRQRHLPQPWLLVLPVIFAPTSSSSTSSPLFFLSVVNASVVPVVVPVPLFIVPEKCSIVIGWLVMGSLVSKDGRSNISRILMPSPYPTAGLCPKTLHLHLVIPPPKGDLIQVLPEVSFWLSYRGRAFIACYYSYNYCIQSTTRPKAANTKSTYEHAPTWSFRPYCISPPPPPPAPPPPAPPAPCSSSATVASRRPRGGP